MNKNQSIGIWVVIGIITASLIMMLWPGFTSSTQEISYTNFLKKVENQEIVSVIMSKEYLIANPKDNKLPVKENQNVEPIFKNANIEPAILQYKVLIPPNDNSLYQKLEDNNVEIKVEKPADANAINAREFLKEVIYEFDFPIKSIQVDGGSEFMGEFEEYCEEQGIKLYVLPPRSPKMNGYVERANETCRYEFWNVYEIPETIEETRKLLKKYERKYNCERPHQSLNYLTPMEYYYKLIENVA